MKKEKISNEFPCAGIKNRVMAEIKTEKVKMKRPLFFLAQKLGLQSILALIIFSGALAVSVILYVLKKSGLLQLLNFGFPGIKKFLSVFPYDYLALVIAAIFLANYILKKIYFSACLVPCKIMSAVLFALVVAIGAIFFLLGIGSAVKF